MNYLRTVFLLAGMTALFCVVGNALGGQSGMLIALIFAGGMNFFMYFNSAKMVLRSYKARVVSESEAPELYRMVDDLRQRAGLPMPTVAIAPHEQPNAFATGRNPQHAVVCVTEGLTRLVDRDELEGVLAHELGHVRNRDMLLQTITATLAGAIASLARFGLFMPSDRGRGRGNPLGLIVAILAPVAAMIIQFAISRSREFKADRAGAEISGKPLALASALQKLDQAAHRIPMNVSPAFAPLAQVNPLAAYGGGIAKLFSTHPSTEERIRRLQAMASG